MKKNVILSIVGVLLVLGIGISFAYFVSQTLITGEGSDVTLTPGDMLKVTYDAGNGTLTGDQLMPGDSVSKDFSVTVTPTETEKEAIYGIFLDLTNNTFVKCDDSNYNDITNACTKGAQELTYTIKDKDSGSTLASGDLTGVTGKVKLLTETKTVDTETTFNYTITITFNDTGADQNHNQNKTIDGNIKVEFTERGSTMSEIIAGYNKGTRSNFGSAYTTSHTKQVFTTTDWEGTSYYFAGAPTDNWVSFGGFYWRIIRVNGDGSTRLLYNGTTTGATGSGTLTKTSQQFNSSYNRSEYVGLKYTSGEQHGQNTNSDILTELNSWYTSSNLDDHASHIDTNIGFCSDRNMASGYSWSSEPSSTIYYAAQERIATNQNPSLACSSNDIVKVPVGLLTADEAMFGGVPWSGNATGNYLINGQNYWTMSPHYFNSGNANVFGVWSDGRLGFNRVVGTVGVRPVINLKADTKFEGSGTSSDPFTVVE